MLEPVILIGEPLIFEGKIKIYPPTVKEVVSNPKFGIFYRLLTMTQDDVRDELKERVTNEFEFPVPFEYLLLSAQYVNGFSGLVKEAISFFCRVEVVISFEEK